MAAMLRKAETPTIARPKAMSLARGSRRPSAESEQPGRSNARVMSGDRHTSGSGRGEVNAGRSAYSAVPALAFRLQPVIRLLLPANPACRGRAYTHADTIFRRPAWQFSREQ